MENVLIAAIVVPATVVLIALFLFAAWVIQDTFRIGPRGGWDYNL